MNDHSSCSPDVEQRSDALHVASFFLVLADIGVAILVTVLDSVFELLDCSKPAGFSNGVLEVRDMIGAQVCVPKVSPS